MKRVFLTTFAFAILAGTNLASGADLPFKAPPRPVPMDPQWTGFYAGLNGGYSWGSSETNVTFINTATGLPIALPAGSISGATFDLNGGVFGGQIGYNWQVDKIVLGVETDIQWSGQKGNASFLCAAVAVTAGPCLPGLTFLPAGAGGTSLSMEQKLEWFGTLRLRGGVLVTPSWLLYATGGFAYGEIQTNTALSGFNGNGLPVAAAATTNATNVGWTIGAGLEGRVWGNWTAKLEYLFMDLGTVSGAVSLAPSPTIAANWSSKITDNIFRVGVNYQFR
jgi:outer membrane immunogenic protein